MCKQIHVCYSAARAASRPSSRSLRHRVDARPVIGREGGAHSLPTARYLLVAMRHPLAALTVARHSNLDILTLVLSG